MIEPKVWRTLVASLFLLLIPAIALAYPSSVVFSPNGEAKPLGTVGLLAYGAINAAPKVTPGSSWFGIEGGPEANAVISLSFDRDGSRLAGHIRLSKTVALPPGFVLETFFGVMGILYSRRLGRLDRRLFLGATSQSALKGHSFSCAVINR